MNLALSKKSAISIATLVFYLLLGALGYWQLMLNNDADELKKLRVSDTFDASKFDIDQMVYTPAESPIYTYTISEGGYNFTIKTTSVGRVIESSFEAKSAYILLQLFVALIILLLDSMLWVYTSVFFKRILLGRLTTQ